MKNLILKLFLFSLLFINGGEIFAHIYLCGDVKEAGTGEPIQGARVEVLNLPIGTITDVDGRYILQLPGPGTYKIKFSYIGFTSQVYTLTANQFEDGDTIVWDDVILGFGLYSIEDSSNKTPLSQYNKRQKLLAHLKREEPLLLLI